jgi:ABC-type tungstate transport system substrate-binding protein
MIQFNMEQKKYFKTIFMISLIGVLFSGYLSYSELTSETCKLGTCSLMLGMPACVYGFIMYLLITIISWFGMRND